MAHKRKRVSAEVKRQARQRARFKCENCYRLTQNQYAHIIPNADGGSEKISNILWLCYECHHNFEAEGKSGVLRESLIKNMKEIRDRAKVDSLVSGIFDELNSSPDLPVYIVLGDVGFRNIGVFSEPQSSYQPSYLRFYRDEHRLKIEGRLKDIDGFTLIEFSGSHLHFHTADIWDLERSSRYLKLQSKSRKIWFELKQQNDLTVMIEGEIYAGGKIISISKRAGIQLPDGGGLKALTIVGDVTGPDFAIGLEASRIPQPIGHVNPDDRFRVLYH